MDIMDIIKRKKIYENIELRDTVDNILSSNKNVQFDYEFPDGFAYCVFNGVIKYELLFDKSRSLFTIQLNLKNLNKICSFNNKELEFVKFDFIVESLNQENIFWRFDKKRTYDHIATIVIDDLRLVYSFDEGIINESRLGYLYTIDENSHLSI